jgi:predicted aspartyl protease
MSDEFTKNSHFLDLAIFIGVISIMFFAPEQNCAGDDLGQQVLFYDDGTSIRVPVRVFGETRYFLLDTGFTVSAIDRQYEQRLGEAITQYRVSTPIAASDALPIYHSPEIVLGGKQLALDKIACLDLTMARLISGQHCDGVLGMDFFSKNIVSVDFDQKKLLLSAKVPATVEGTAVAIPLKQVSQHYAAEVLINKTQNLDLLNDTGDNGSISLNSTDWQEVFSNNLANIFTATIAGINNQVVQSKIGRIECLRSKAMAIPTFMPPSSVTLWILRILVLIFLDATM